MSVIVTFRVNSGLSSLRMVLMPLLSRLLTLFVVFSFFFSSRRRHTRYWRDWSSDVCSSDLCTRCCNRWDSLSGRHCYCWWAPRGGRRSWPAPPADCCHWYLSSASAVRYRERRSEERRVGKECRSRGARYRGEERKTDTTMTV